MASNRGKKTKGRQKIEMKKIENEDDRLITFSKRRSGIYKKACELVTLTGAEIAFVVFSPAGKPFSFAHPSIESVTNRFLGKEILISPDSTHPLVEAHRQIRIEELNHHHNDVLQQLDVVKDKGKNLKHKATGIEKMGWWDTPIEELNVKEMIQMESAFNDIRISLISKLKEKVDSNNIGASSCSSSSSSAQPPIDPSSANMINPFVPINEPNPPVFPSGYDYGHRPF
ncbi:hypothetical protein JCGZ_04579 [Jatropha curcas]|uniref:MADS-box domain-containing protein n=1 Tax=Jatropha curcas TaxID=180498 RepID=A0A067KNX8_JATCU|nr:agamous-like MADS-box protein AGL62 [Jatropha curcas]KDP37936.1 hypothetical protein JCGZ_04579 [Jatropha curcas]